jgi:putative restriction endonuclease
LSTLHQYLYKFTHLKRGVTKYGLAPHKPILLLTLLELIGKGHILENKVYVDTELVGTFQENWRLLVSSLNQPDFTQPFYYLQSDQVEGKPFWHLIAKPACQINSHIKSVNTLINVLDHAAFAEDLFISLTEPVHRNRFLAAILDAYFPDVQSYYYESKREGKGYFHDLENFVLNESEVKYRTVKIETEEDVYVRSGLFKKLVPKVYNSTCCITGMRLESTFGHSFIDACHIIPFSVSHDDKVNNGLALCPNLHRAFDRGLITVDMDYRIITSEHINENGIHPYSLKQLNGKKITLPASPNYQPSLENLEWHRSNIFKN